VQRELEHVEADAVRVAEVLLHRASARGVPAAVDYEAGDTLYGRAVVVAPRVRQGLAWGSPSVCMLCVKHARASKDWVLHAAFTDAFYRYSGLSARFLTRPPGFCPVPL